MKVLHSVLVLCIGNSIQARELIVPRIHGGNNAVEREFPFLAALNRKQDIFLCGGSILNNNYVLTAGHCVYKDSYDGIFVRIGSVDWHKSPAREVDSIIVHEEFVVCETGMLENDLALLKLKILLEFDDHIQPIPLIDYEIPDQSKVVVSGWGTETGGWQSAKILNKITLIKINLEICKKQYEYKEEIYIGDGKICTFTKYGEGICEGDSGSPLMYHGKIVGVTSFGRIPCSTGLPDGFVDVYYYRDWILKRISNDSLNSSDS